MALSVDLNSYQYTKEELDKLNPRFTAALEKVNTALKNLDSRVLAYVDEDLEDIKKSLEIMQSEATTTKEKIINAQNEYSGVENKATNRLDEIMDSTLASAAAVGTGAGALIGGIPGAIIGTAVGIVVGANKEINGNQVDNATIENATGSKVASFCRSIGNFFSGAVDGLNNMLNKIGTAVVETGAKVGSAIKSGASKVASYLGEVGDFLWDSVTHPLETLKKVGASITNTAVALIQGIGEFLEAIVDTIAVIGTAVASIFTGLADLYQWINGKVTGNENWNSVTKAMWNGVMGFVATSHVKNGFDSFHQNNSIGKWIDENSYGPFKSTGAIYQVADGIGYVAGVIALTIATFGVGGAVASGTAVTTSTITVTAGQTAIVAGTAGFGRGAETAWSNGATLSEGLTYAILNAGWEGLQFYVGAKIGAPGGYGDQIAGKILSQTASQGTRALVSSGTRIILDSADGGIEGFVQPLLQIIYADGYYDDAGNYIEFTENDNLMFRAQALFDDMGGWSNVGIQSAIGGVGSLLGETGNLRQMLAPVGSGGSDLPASGVLAIGGTSLIAQDPNLIPSLGNNANLLQATDLNTNSIAQIDINSMLPSGNNGDILQTQLTNGKSLSLTDNNPTITLDLDITQPLPKVDTTLTDANNKGYVDATESLYGKQSLPTEEIIEAASVDASSTILPDNELAPDASVQSVDNLDITQPLNISQTKAVDDLDITQPIFPEEVQAAAAVSTTLLDADANTSKIVDIQASDVTSKKVTEMTSEEITAMYQTKKSEVDPLDSDFFKKWDLLDQQEKLLIELTEKLKGVNTDTVSPKNIDLLTPSQRIKVEKIAQQIYDNALKQEPSISAMMKSLEGTDAQLAGFDYRFKTLEGIQDKIARNLQKGYSLTDVNDSLRYTLLVDESSYTDTVMKKLAQLKQAGYEVKYLNNSWGNNGFATYQGLNITMLSPDGTMVEIQFHTQASFDIKQTVNHDFYEISRNKTMPSDIVLLSDQIQSINQQLYVKDVGFDITNTYTLDQMIDKYITKSTTSPISTYKSYQESNGYSHFIQDNNDNFKSWQQALTEDPNLNEAINAYKGESNIHPASYKIINAYYRGTLFDDVNQTVTITGTGGYQTKYTYAQYESMVGCSITEFKTKIEKAAQTMSEGIGKCHLAEDTQLIRGVHMDTLKYKFGIEETDSISTIIAKLKANGGVWEEQGYMSACPRVSDSDLPYIVTSKKVQLVMDVESDIDARLYGNPTYGDVEMEVLLDKNQTFDITNVEEKNGKIYIYMKHRAE